MDQQFEEIRQRAIASTDDFLLTARDQSAKWFELLASFDTVDMLEAKGVVGGVGTKSRAKGITSLGKNNRIRK